MFSVGSDGTNVNIGHLNGIICSIEKWLGHAVQWVICLLHLNELPLRHLFLSYDGKPTGPNSFSGPIGKQLNECHLLPVVDFQPLPNFGWSQLEHEILKTFSTDQAYLYEITSAVITGEVSQHLAILKPGPVNHSRWLTTASRLLRLYIYLFLNRLMNSLA